MRLAGELVQMLREAWSGRAVPRVRSLYLPPVPWMGGKDGEFGALELDTGALGLSCVLQGDTLATLAADGVAVQGADALAVASWWAEGSGARAALGFAAVNALTRQLFDDAGFVPPPAADSIGGLDPVPGEHIGMVGCFPPLVKQVTARGARLTVLELRAHLAGEHEGWRITLDARDLADCTQVLCTSTVLLNHTLDEVLAACRQARRIALTGVPSGFALRNSPLGRPGGLIGPGAGCLPDGLFARGVTLLGGTWVVDGAAFVRALAVGAPWGFATRKFALAREGCQGLVALLERGAGARARAH